jgi:hypothetical protein
MSDFNSALYDQQTEPSLPLPSAHAIATDVIRRDQRRTRLLAILCIVFWIAAVAGMVLMVTGLNKFLMGVRLGNARRFLQPAVERNTDSAKTSSPDQSGPSSESTTNDPANDQPPSAGPPVYWDDGTDLFHHTLPFIDGSLIVLFFAGASTVLLIFSSRRTTMNRINLSLAQIAEQLKALGAPAGPTTHAAAREPSAKTP